MAESSVPSTECRLYLVDRLVRKMQHVTNQIEANTSVSSKFKTMVQEYDVVIALEQVALWLQDLAGKPYGSYPGDLGRQVRALLSSVSRREVN